MWLVPGIVNDEGKIKEALERALANTINDPAKSREAFQRTLAEESAGERSLMGFLESAQDILNEMAGDPLANHYFKLLERFIAKFGLRYDLRRPCILPSWRLGRHFRFSRAALMAHLGQCKAAPYREGK
jgi:hypothetical protein